MSINQEQKEKNIRDLEYNHLLNKQSIALVLLGTAIISVILISKLPEGIKLNKLELLISLSIALALVFQHFSKKLEKKVEEIRNL